MMSSEYNGLVKGIFSKKGFTVEEVWAIANVCEKAMLYGKKEYGLRKVLEMGKDWVPGAQVTKLESKYGAVRRWVANGKSGPFVAYDAMKTCIDMAEVYGTGTVVVENCGHYLWGGLYVMEAAKRGYVAFTSMTGSKAEIVPEGGRLPVMGERWEYWGLPTVKLIGYPVVMEWSNKSDKMVDGEGYLTENRRYAKGFRSLCGGVGDFMEGTYFHVVKPEALGMDGVNGVDVVKKLVSSGGSGGSGGKLPGLDMDVGMDAGMDAGMGMKFMESEMDDINRLAEEYGVDKLKKT